MAQALAGTTGRPVTSQTRNVPIHAWSELPQILSALAIEGRALDALRLIALSAFLDSIDESRAAIRNAPGSFAILEAAASGAASFKGETAQVRNKIEQSGEVVDTPARSSSSFASGCANSGRAADDARIVLRGKETAKYLQEQIVTERSGRYVLVVKAEHRSAIPGIVHGASTSGASLFLEPLSTVEINNEIVALEEQEAEEVRRILLALTDAFRGRAGDLQRTIAAATELDVLQARARYSVSIDGVEPQITGDGTSSSRRPGIRWSRRRAGHHQGDPAGVRAAHHWTEYGRQDRRAENGRPVCADGAGWTLGARRRRIAAAGVPIDLRRHRRRTIDRREPEHVLGAHHQHRLDGPRVDDAGAGAAR